MRENVVSIGVDLGGTKIEAAALDGSGAFMVRRRVGNPGDYDGAIRVLVDLIGAVEAEVDATGPVGVGLPGFSHPRDGLIRNSNATFLNRRPFGADLAAALGRPVRVANDANCMVLSEAVDGAAASAGVVFGIIVGTGVGGGLVVDGRIVEGANGLGGEWGHLPVPWLGTDESDTLCWCGQRGCMETMISGTGFERVHAARTGHALRGPEIVAAARAGDRAALASVDTYVGRLGRALAMIVNIVDPDVIVLGGGMSNVTEIYPRLPDIVRAHVFGGEWTAPILPATWGDSSGVRGAARLWPQPEGATQA